MPNARMRRCLASAKSNFVLARVASTVRATLEMVRFCRFASGRVPAQAPFDSTPSSMRFGYAISAGNSAPHRQHSAVAGIVGLDAEHDKQLAGVHAKSVESYLHHGPQVQRRNGRRVELDCNCKGIKEYLKDI